MPLDNEEMYGKLAPAYTPSLEILARLDRLPPGTFEVRPRNGQAFTLNVSKIVQVKKLDNGLACVYVSVDKFLFKGDEFLSKEEGFNEYVVRDTYEDSLFAWRRAAETLVRDNYYYDRAKRYASIAYNYISRRQAEKLQREKIPRAESDKIPNEKGSSPFRYNQSTCEHRRSRCVTIASGAGKCLDCGKVFDDGFPE